MTNSDSYLAMKNHSYINAAHVSYDNINEEVSYVENMKRLQCPQLCSCLIDAKITHLGYWICS